jgi:large subunit ribosomal protein L13
MNANEENKQKKEEFVINAKGKALGRVASETAAALRGKNLISYQPNSVPKRLVRVLNISEIRLTGGKWKQKKYKKHSGYPGGLKTKSYEDLFKKNPKQAFRQTVLGMLPKNKLRKQAIKNLIFG